MYEFNDSGGLTTTNNECASASEQIVITVMWIISIAAAASYDALIARVPSGVKLARLTWPWCFGTIAATIAVAIVVGLTHWQD